MPSYDPMTNVEIRQVRGFFYGHATYYMEYRVQTLGNDGNRFCWTEWKPVPLVDYEPQKI